MKRNLPYKSAAQVKRLRDVSKPVRRYGDHSAAVPTKRRRTR